ncbi:hypothetical protein [Streptomyces benahoarensis]|uniref:hypothetical protein n=1 Tax=Streptomyces benahoarensis TaxID=2595054 RepID=UPI002036224F|nr:hypothetical protein [Streptomyces benahoarensis]
MSAAQAVALTRGGHVALAALDTASHIDLSRPGRHGGPRAGRVKSVGRRANGRTLLPACNGGSTFRHP